MFDAGVISYVPHLAPFLWSWQHVSLKLLNVKIYAREALCDTMHGSYKHVEGHTSVGFLSKHVNSIFMLSVWFLYNLENHSSSLLFILTEVDQSAPADYVATLSIFHHQHYFYINIRSYIVA
jgi:hypothetical protein